jgi:diaminopimelate epimerase
MTPLTLTKHHALGNDFLCAVDPSRPVTPQLAQAWCDRRRGVGADGVLVGQAAGAGRWTMGLWNADGSRAEISGNGIRCLGQAILAHQGGRAPARLVIDTDAGPRDLALEPTEDPRTLLVRVSMGPARALAHELDGVLAGAGVNALDVVGVDLGNPHVVVRVDDPEAHDLALVGPAVEAGHPGGINVHLMALAGTDRLAMRVWERGVGVTEACGSGACAAAWAAHRWGLVDRVVTVEMPGGAATVEVGDPMVLTGPTTRVAAVVVDV